jgi:hypothetical protein
MAQPGAPLGGPDAVAVLYDTLGPPDPTIRFTVLSLVAAIMATAGVPIRVLAIVPRIEGIGKDRGYL